MTLFLLIVLLSLIIYLVYKKIGRQRKPSIKPVIAPADAGPVAPTKPATIQAAPTPLKPPEANPIAQKMSEISEELSELELSEPKKEFLPPAEKPPFEPPPDLPVG